jgi:hypothetical protein
VTDQSHASRSADANAREDAVRDVGQFVLASHDGLCMKLHEPLLLYGIHSARWRKMSRLKDVRDLRNMVAVGEEKVGIELAFCNAALVLVTCAFTRGEGKSIYTRSGI